MKADKRYGSITSLEVEISSFTGGGYKVRYDFVRRLISWNDGYMWNNNFMKSLTPEKLQVITSNLPGTINETPTVAGHVFASGGTFTAVYDAEANIVGVYITEDYNGSKQYNLTTESGITAYKAA